MAQQFVIKGIEEIGSETMPCLGKGTGGHLAEQASPAPKFGEEDIQLALHGTTQAIEQKSDQ